MTHVEIKKVRDEPSSDDGLRLLVDRLWPRGVSKDDAELDGHPKDVAPSTELRQWFDHDPEKFQEFGDRYRAELDDNDAARDLAAKLRDERPQQVTLLYGAKDDEHNHAIVLRDWLRDHL